MKNRIQILGLFFGFTCLLLAGCSETRSKKGGLFGLFGDATLDSAKVKAENSADSAKLAVTPDVNRPDTGLLTLPEKQCTITGKVVGGAGTNIILDQLLVGKVEPLQSMTINRNNEFQFVFPLRQAELLELRFANNDAIHIPVHPGQDLYFDINMENVSNFQVQGSLEPTLLRSMYLEIEKINDLKDAVQHQIDDEKVASKIETMLDTMNNEIKRINHKKDLALMDIADHNDTSFTALLIAHRLGGSENTEWLIKMDKKLSKRYPYSPFYKDLHSKVLMYSPTAIGKTAPDIICTEANGKAIRLSSLRGKNLILYYWNSGCKMCQDNDFKLLMDLKKKYKKSLEVIAINLDNTKQDWLDALQVYPNTFLNVYDAGGLNSPSANVYTVPNIPYNVVINKNGIIISRDSREGALQKVIRELK